MRRHAVLILKIGAQATEKQLFHYQGIVTCWLSNRFLRNVVMQFYLYKKNQVDALISQIYFLMKLYMFRLLPIIRSLFTVHSAMVYVIQVCRQISSRTRMEWSCSCSKAVYKPVWHITLLSVQWKNSWWWTDELSETCRVSWQNKFLHPSPARKLCTNLYDIYHCWVYSE